MYEKNSLNADELDQILDEAAVTFPTSVDEIKMEMADVGAPSDVMMFFEEIQPGTRFDHKEELLNMAEQRSTDQTTTTADIQGETRATDILDTDDEIF